MLDIQNEIVSGQSEILVLFSEVRLWGMMLFLKSENIIMNTAQSMRIVPLGLFCDLDLVQKSHHNIKEDCVMNFVPQYQTLVFSLLSHILIVFVFFLLFRTFQKQNVLKRKEGLCSFYIRYERRKIATLITYSENRYIN